MTDLIPQSESRSRRVDSPRAAAAAGILFAILFTISMVLIHLAVPETLVVSTGWVEKGAGQIHTALALTPFAGIAFLWFIGVIRDHIGAAEDKLFSTVFLGSCLLFLALIFASAAIAGGLLSSAAVITDRVFLAGIAVYSRAIMLQISNIYALRMAAVIMTSLAATWLQTGKMPRWMGYTTYALAAVLLLVTTNSLWMTLIFPAWVFVISVYILVMRMRDRTWGTARA